MVFEIDVRFKEYETIKKWYSIAMVGAKLKLILRKHTASLVARESWWSFKLEILFCKNILFNLIPFAKFW